MTQLQTFLREGGTLQQLNEQYFVKTTRHSAHPNLVLFKYNQIFSPMDEPIVREARGIILDESDDWRCVARGFDKFFNYGEPNAVAIDWTTARVQEKVDGSLCLLYHYADAWHVATTGSPDASGHVHDNRNLTFAALFWRTLAGYLPPESFAETVGDGGTGWSYLFELTSPHNRVVVAHTEARLTLFGARNLETGAWARGEEITSLPRVPHVREYPLTSFEEILATFEAIKPLEQEGYVVVDAAHNRVKVKHPGYVALHQAKDGLTERALADILRRGETSEVIAVFPELGASFAALTVRYDALVGEIESDYARLRDIVEQRDFAQVALKTRCSAALFQLRSGRVGSVREYLADATPGQFYRMMGLKEEDSRKGGEE